MSRSFVQGWGAALDDARFACALAWLGSFRFYRGKQHHGDRQSYPWYLGAVDTWRAEVDPDQAADAWLKEVANVPGHRLAMEVYSSTPLDWPIPYPFQRDFDLHWLVDTLVRAKGVTSVSLVQPDHTQRAWDWPLDVAFFSDPRSKSLWSKLTKTQWPDFVRFVDAKATNAAIDLLLFPGSLPEALAAVVEAPRTPPIHTILALGGAGKSRDIYASLTALRTEADSLASGVIDVPVRRVHEWLDRLLLHLSADLSFDEALFSATNAFSRTVPIITAPAGALSFARTGFVVRETERKLAFTPTALAHRIIPESVRRRLAFPEAAPPDEIASHLRRIPEAFRDWEQPTGAASELAELTGALRNQVPPPDGRFVQAKVFAGDQALDNTPLVPGKVHRLDVRIARGGEGWTVAPEKLPENELPPNVTGHELTVVFVAPSLLSEPQSARLWLPAQGDSESCSFHFLVKEGLTTLEARVMILFENRLLQTLRLKARVGEGSNDGPMLALDLEAVLRTRLDDLAGAPGFDVSIVLNDSQGVNGINAIAGPKVAYASMSSNLEKLLKSLQGELEAIKDAPEDFDDPLGEPTRELLVTLARAGYSFLESLQELPGMKVALSSLESSSGRVQVTSMHPDEIVPLEFIYDRGFPEVTAKLCAGMQLGKQCGSNCSRDDDTICPLGFWGMRHIIERRFYDPVIAKELQNKGASFSIGAEICEHQNALQPLRSVLFSSSSKAANFNRRSFDATITSIQKMLQDDKKRFVPVDAWKDWVVQIQEIHPEILLLLPHTEMLMGANVLEIGTQDYLAAAKVKTGYVREPPATPPEAGPLVLLLGCRTAMEEVPFSNFIAAFRRARASVIVATMSTVRGRHMAPVAEEAIRLILKRAQGPRCAIGEMIRELRHELLVKGLPVGLTLVAFGDVDWQIGGSS